MTNLGMGFIEYRNPSIVVRWASVWQEDGVLSTYVNNIARRVCRGSTGSGSEKINGYPL